MPRLSRRSRGVAVSNRMLKKSASLVLAALRGSTYRSVRLASSLAAALPDGLFEHPAWCAPLLHVRDKKRTLSRDSHTKHTRLAGRARHAESGLARLVRLARTDIFSASCSPVGPRPQIGAPVRPPIGTWPHIIIGVDTGGHVFQSGPNLHTLDVDDGIGIVGLIQW